MQFLPEALAPFANYRQFIIYVLAPHPTKPGKTNKFPCDFRTGRVVGAHDPEVWTDFPTAAAAAAHYGHGYGVGFVFTLNDPFWFLDIDGAYDGQRWSDIATELVAAFPGAAVEVSSSGKGLHIFGTGPVPPHKTKNEALGLELYNTKRFVALTGLNAQGSAATDCSHLLPALVAKYFPADTATLGHIDGWTETACEGWNGPEDDDKLIERMLKSRPAAAAFGEGITFADLWNADVDQLAKHYPPDPGSTLAYGGSTVDSALAQRLAFWTGKNCERIKRLMFRSALVREKWERDDYIDGTILKVCARQADYLSDKHPEPLSHFPAYAPPPPEGERRASPRPTAVTGSTFLGVEEQFDFFNGCVYILDAHRVLTPGGAQLKEAQFRVMYGGYSFSMDNANERTSRDPWEAFTQSQAFRSPKADSACFKPDREPGELITDAGRIRVNVWWPVDVPRAVGDATPFYTHLAKLLPDERDRYILLCYMAACVQHKGYKFQWAPLLQGVEGNGKTLLSRCVAEAVGLRYVHWPKASKLAKEFNAWMVGKVFYAVEDIYVPDSRRDVMEELKPMITGGDGLEIESKGVDQISADICGNFMFNSNHQDAILKHRNDRRFGMFFTAQQQAADLIRDGMSGNYMSDLYNWLRTGGYAIVSELLHTFPIPDEYNPARQMQRAPVTTSTEAAIQNSMGRVEQEIMEAVAQGLQGFAGDWISSVWLDRLLVSLGHARALSRSKRVEVLQSLGYVRHPGLVDGRVNNIILPDAAKPVLYVRIGSPAAALVGPSVIASAYSNAQEIKTLEAAQ